MKPVEKMAAQGDVLFRKVAAIPNGFEKAKKAGPVVVAHSETGHHHSIHEAAVDLYEQQANGMVCYLQLQESGGCEVVHHRPYDTHETLKLLGEPGDIWEVRRQREHTPEGWRRVED